MSTRWLVGAATHPGRERSRNEDHLSADALGPDRWALTVCDGMGGHADGHIASATAVEVLRPPLDVLDDERPFETMHAALRAADRAVAEAGRREDEPDGSLHMGTTAVVAWLDGPRMWYGWVGDSRLYLVRGGSIVERTTDHTVVQALVASGALTPEQAVRHAQSHVLAQALGTGEARPSVYAEPVECAPGDRVLLCSDGLHDLVDDAEIPALLDGQDAQTVADALVALANERGGHDNISVIVAIRTEQPDEPTGPPRGDAPPDRDAGPPVTDGGPAEASGSTSSSTNPALAAPVPRDSETAATRAAGIIALLLVGIIVGFFISNVHIQPTPDVVPEASAP